MKRNQLLLSPDAGTGEFANADAALAAQPENAVDPILQENLDDVSTTDPLFPKGDVEAEVVKVFSAPTKKGGSMVKIELKTVGPHTAVTGDPIPTGRRIFDQIVTTPVGGLTKEMIQRSLKRFQAACGGTGAFFPLEQYVGSRVTVKLGMKKPSDEYPDEANEVKGYAKRSNG